LRKLNPFCKPICRLNLPSHPYLHLNPAQGKARLMLLQDHEISLFKSPPTGVAKYPLTGG
jgi:hypothetical protein